MVSSKVDWQLGEDALGGIDVLAPRDGHGLIVERGEGTAVEMRELLARQLREKQPLRLAVHWQQRQFCAHGFAQVGFVRRELHLGRGKG